MANGLEERTMLMKKMFPTIELHKLKTKINEDSLEKIRGMEFYVLFDDGTYKHCYSTLELRHCLENDYKKPIRYVFDAIDRIIISRDIQIKENIDGI